jgi:hypothetical protein
MSAMTGDVRDRILSLLRAGPATVARLSAGLGVAGGVVSYELKLLERDGLVRVGTSRREHGVPTPVYVSTAAAAPPALPAPAPIPGLTWLAGEPYPTPLWTVPRPPDPPSHAAGSTEDPGAGPVARPADELPPEAVPAEPTEGADAAPRERTEDRTAGESPAALTPPSRLPAPRPRRSPGLESPRGPRLQDIRRVPMDDATFYEFAERLDALSREFAARATPGAPAAELTVRLVRPDDETAGYGS